MTKYAKFIFNLKVCDFLRNVVGVRRYVYRNLTSSIKEDVSRDSVVGIATRYGLGGPGNESRWGEIFRTRVDRPWGPPSLLYNRYRVFPGGRVARGMALTTHPHLAPMLKKENSYISTPTLGLRGLLQGELQLYL
jgi:hypothetical protein